MPEAMIQWPQDAANGGEFQECNKLILTWHSLLIGAFAAIHGLNVSLQTSQDEYIENATYNSWLAEHFISSVLVFLPKGQSPPSSHVFVYFSLSCLFTGIIIAAVINAPGSWHDSRVARPIYEKLRTQTPEGYYFIADTAFPRGTATIEGQICAPLKAGQNVRGTEAQIEVQLGFDRELLSYQQTAEWGNCALQGAFGCLWIPLQAKNAEQQGNSLEICNQLHNICTWQVGINQIWTVYMDCWQGNAVDHEIWNHFENMLFSDQCKNDRVSHFHTYAEYN